MKQGCVWFWLLSLGLLSQSALSAEKIPAECTIEKINERANKVIPQQERDLVKLDVSRKAALAAKPPKSTTSIDREMRALAKSQADNINTQNRCVCYHPEHAELCEGNRGLTYNGDTMLNQIGSSLRMEGTVTVAEKIPAECTVAKIEDRGNNLIPRQERELRKFEASRKVALSAKPRKSTASVDAIMRPLAKSAADNHNLQYRCACYHPQYGEICQAGQGNVVSGDTILAQVGSSLRMVGSATANAQTPTLVSNNSGSLISNNSSTVVANAQKQEAARKSALAMIAAGKALLQNPKTAAAGKAQIAAGEALLRQVDGPMAATTPTSTSGSSSSLSSNNSASTSSGSTLNGSAYLPIAPPPAVSATKTSTATKTSSAVATTGASSPLVSANSGNLISNSQTPATLPLPSATKTSTATATSTTVVAPPTSTPTTGSSQAMTPHQKLREEYLIKLAKEQIAAGQKMLKDPNPNMKSAGAAQVAGGQAMLARAQAMAMSNTPLPIDNPTPPTQQPLPTWMTNAAGIGADMNFPVSNEGQAEEKFGPLLPGPMPPPMHSGCAEKDCANIILSPSELKVFARVQCIGKPASTFSVKDEVLGTFDTTCTGKAEGDTAKQRATASGKTVTAPASECSGTLDCQRAARRMAAHIEYYCDARAEYFTHEGTPVKISSKEEMLPLYGCIGVDRFTDYVMRIKVLDQVIKQSSAGE